MVRDNWQSFSFVTQDIFHFRNDFDGQCICASVTGTVVTLFQFKVAYQLSALAERKDKQVFIAIANVLGVDKVTAVL